MSKMDKTVFKAHSFSEARKYNNISKDLPVSERLKEAHTLTLTVYGYAIDKTLKVDRTVFSMRKHKI